MSPLLFLHGAGTSDKEITTYLQDALYTYSIGSYSFNFTGHGGDKTAMVVSSLAKRLREAEQAIQNFHLVEPLNLCGSSMGGYITIKLLEKYQVENLILFAPAVYAVEAFALPFDASFTSVIRQKDSWKNSDAFSILKNYTGNVLIFIGDKDEVIPRELIRHIDQSLVKVKSKELITIPHCPHKIHRWLSQNKEWTEVVAEKIAHYIDRK